MELSVALDELRQVRAREQSQWAEEQQQLRELVDRPKENAEAENNVDQVSPSQPSERHDSTRVERTGESPVFASIKEQFGKLRQQRAMDRPAPKKAR
jgi:hypothetical protein